MRSPSRRLVPHALTPATSADAQAAPAAFEDGEDDADHVIEHGAVPCRPGLTEKPWALLVRKRAGAAQIRQLARQARALERVEEGGLDLYQRAPDLGRGPAAISRRMIEVTTAAR